MLEPHYLNQFTKMNKQQITQYIQSMQVSLIQNVNTASDILHTTNRISLF